MDTWYGYQIFETWAWEYWAYGSFFIVYLSHVYFLMSQKNPILILHRKWLSSLKSLSDKKTVSVPTLCAHLHAHDFPHQNPVPRNSSPLTRPFRDSIYSSLSHWWGSSTIILAPYNLWFRTLFSLSSDVCPSDQQHCPSFLCSWQPPNNGFHVLIHPMETLPEIPPSFQCDKNYLDSNCSYSLGLRWWTLQTEEIGFKVPFCVMSMCLVLILPDLMTVVWVSFIHSLNK